MQKPHAAIGYVKLMKYGTPHIMTCNRSMELFSLICLMTMKFINQSLIPCVYLVHHSVCDLVALAGTSPAGIYSFLPFSVNFSSKPRNSELVDSGHCSGQITRMALGTEVRSPRLPSSHSVGANNQDMAVFLVDGSLQHIFLSQSHHSKRKTWLVLGQTDG